MDNKPRDFAFHIGSLILLYVCLFMTTSLVFGIINLLYPNDSLEYYYVFDSGNSQIRNAVAALIVFFPAYILITRKIFLLRNKEHVVYPSIMKWVIYLSLVLGGVSLLGDVAYLINHYLNGELGVRVFLKILAFFVIIGAAFVFYVLDVRGYWDTHALSLRVCTLVVIGTVTCTLVYGLTQIESPSRMREIRIDHLQVSQLQTMQYRVENQFFESETVPENIGELLQEGDAFLVPPGREPYTYTKTGEASYTLCADFKESTPKRDAIATQPLRYADDSLVSWDHGAGFVCFERSVKPTKLRSL